MTVETIINQSGIPLLLFVVCLYYGLRLVITQDAKLILGGRNKRVRDEKEYARRSGKLILFYAAGTLLMAVLLLVNTLWAVVEILLWTMALGVGWKVMSDQCEM